MGGVSFASVNSDGVYNAWAKVPEEGKLQILCLLLALETANESKKPHYMRGGVPGRIDSLPFDRAAGTSGLWAPKIKFWDPLNFTGALSAEQKAQDGRRQGQHGGGARREDSQARDGRHDQRAHLHRHRRGDQGGHGGRKVPRPRRRECLREQVELSLVHAT